MKKIWIISILLVIAMWIGCSKENHAPVISSVTISPDSVEISGTATASVTATDEDVDPITFTWSASAGSLSSNTGTSVTWTAPSTAGVSQLTVIAADDQGGADTLVKDVKVYIPSYHESGSNTNSVMLYDGYWSSSDISITGPPSTALADSIELTCNITHSYPSYLVIALEDPDNNQSTLWDGNYPGGQQTIKLYVQGDIHMCGTWTLWVGVYSGGGNGMLNNWSLEVWGH